MNLTPSPRIPRWPACLLLGLGLLLAHAGNASCTMTRNVRPDDGYNLKIGFGRINLPPESLLYPGASLGTIVVPATDYPGKSPDTVLWTCDKADLANPDLHFLVSTNGDSRFGGHNDIGRPDGLHDVYATWFRNIGLRLNIDGVYLSRFWRKVPLNNNYLEDDQGKIHIRLKDIPPLQAELLWVSTESPPKAGNPGSLDCQYYEIGASRPTPQGTSYRCPYPNAYLHLRGPGLEKQSDNAGDDHHTMHQSWRSKNGIGYRLYQSVTLGNTVTCVVRSATPQVTFAPMSVQQLQDKQTASAHFNIVVDCNNPVKSGTGDNDTAIGLQASQGAFNAAQGLKLVNGKKSTQYLLSDQYGAPGMARGVGIQVHDGENRLRRFVGQPGTVGKGHPRGEDAGWYPVLLGAQPMGASDTSNTLHQLNFHAELVRLPESANESLTPGKIHTSATILVKVQ